MKWLRHAFAVDEPGPAQPTEPERVVVERVCVEIVRRHLSTPALIFLETSRPLNYLGAQAMHFFQPIVSAILDGDGYRHFGEFLERRGSVDYLCERIGALDARTQPRANPEAAGDFETRRSERHERD